MYAADRGDINGMDKAHRRRWALPLNQRVPLVGVIIDAGHGGNGPGVVYSGVREADVNWTYAWMLREKFIMWSNTRGMRRPQLKERLS